MLGHVNWWFVTDVSLKLDASIFRILLTTHSSAPTKMIGAANSSEMHMKKIISQYGVIPQKTVLSAVPLASIFLSEIAATVCIYLLGCIKNRYNILARSL
jgi:hypothetical protein